MNNPNGQGAKKYQEIHPKGIYEVEITGQALAETKPKNNEPAKPFLKLKVKVNALKKADNGQKPNIILGGTRFIDLYFTEKTIERTKKLIVAAGFKGKSLAQLSPEHPQHQSLLGFKFDASNTPEQYKDKTGATKWQDKFSALPIGDRDPNAWMSKINTANTTRVMALDALFNSVKVDVAQAPAAPPAPDQQQAAQEEDPFAGQTGSGDGPNVPWEPEGPSDSDAGAFNW